MKWTDYDERLRKLWNSIATTYCNTVSDATAQKEEAKAYKIMEELTELLKGK